MALSIQQLSDESKLSHALRFEVLEQLCPPELVSDLLRRCHAWGERERSLNQLLVVYYVIALSLFRWLNLAAVLAHLVRGLRWLWSNPSLRLPTAAALVYRRRQLGTPVMRYLFQRICQLMATEQTRGAFRFGLRLMAIDGTLDEVADTPANALYFGRMSSGNAPPATRREHQQWRSLTRRCLFIKFGRHHKLISWARELASPGVSLPYFFEFGNALGFTLKDGEPFLYDYLLSDFGTDMLSSQHR